MSLTVVMYHYVRDLPRTPYPRLKGMLLEDFRAQLTALTARYEMATLESGLAYLRGEYEPARDLCLLTFDDGLKEHYREVTPLLAERGIQGQFFVITGCLEDAVVAPVHMNHFLMAGLDFEVYRRAFLDKLGGQVEPADESLVRKTYPWDTPDVATFKYLFNFILKPEVRDGIVRTLFEEYIGPEADFARELYVSWEEARRMQAAGMIVGGHTHAHRPLAALTDGELESDLRTCRALIDCRLERQALVPFCYPYGKKTSFTGAAVKELERLRFACAFSTEAGDNQPGAELFAIRRIDCKNA